HALAGIEHGRRSIANLRKLLELAVDSPDLSPMGYVEEIKLIQSVRQQESEAPTMPDSGGFVRLTTIWKAKGLEFPVVVAAGLGMRQNSWDHVWVDGPTGLPAVEVPGTTKGPAASFLRDRHKKEMSDEDLRLAYVTLTRAQRRLCFIVGELECQGALQRIGGRLTAPGGLPPGVVPLLPDAAGPAV
ncbi:MAG: hypothetical protein MH204_06810, partial [Fimbriimonadaceae bacterium]|nr:hypothetical protein [Fimbriimonadaceae bacterium]